MHSKLYTSLVLGLCLLSINTLLGMGDYRNSAYQYRYSGETEYFTSKTSRSGYMPEIMRECLICYGDVDHTTKLHCGHESYCTECLKSVLANAFLQNNTQQARCPNPDCKEAWNETDFNAMESFAKAEITRLKQKMIDDAAPIKPIKLDFRTKLLLFFNSTPCPRCGVKVIRTEGCNHMSCTHPTCKEHFCYMCGEIWNQRGESGYQIHSACSAKKRIEYMWVGGTIALVGGAALYKLGSKLVSQGKTLTNKILIKYPPIRPKINALKEMIKEKMTEHSSLLASILIGTTSFTALTLSQVDLELLVRSQLYRKLGDIRYCNLMDSWSGKIFDYTLQNKHLLHTGISAGIALTSTSIFKLCTHNPSRAKAIAQYQKNKKGKYS